MSRIRDAVSRIPSLGAISVMPDYFVDRIVRVGSLEGLVAAMKRKSVEGGGGSIRGIRQSEVKGGNAVNIGFALGSLDAKVNLIAIADSLPAATLKATFAKMQNVDLYIVDGTPGFTIAFEFMENEKSVNVMVSDVGDIDSFDGSKLSESQINAISKSSIVAIVNWSSNRRGNELCRKVYSLAKEKGARTFFDPADVSGQIELLPEFKRTVLDRGLVDIISLNDNEARIISKSLYNHDLPLDYSNDELLKTAKLLADQTGTNIDLHTRRISLSASEDYAISSSCYNVAQVKVTGAGDVWAAADILGYLTDLEAESRLRFANATAGLYVSRESVDTPSLEQILAFLENEDLAH